jgi:hypothetical protein
MRKLKGKYHQEGLQKSVAQIRVWSLAFAQVTIVSLAQYAPIILMICIESFQMVQ